MISTRPSIKWLLGLHSVHDPHWNLLIWCDFFKQALPTAKYIIFVLMLIGPRYINLLFNLKPKIILILKIYLLVRLFNNGSGGFIAKKIYKKNNLKAAENPVAWLFGFPRVLATGTVQLL